MIETGRREWEGSGSFISYHFCTDAEMERFAESEYWKDGPNAEYVLSYPYFTDDELNPYIPPLELGDRVKIVVTKETE